MKIYYESDKYPVYIYYLGDFSSPPDGIIELDFRDGGSISAEPGDFSGSGTPSYLWKGDAIRFYISPYTPGKEINKLFKNKKFIGLCEDLVTLYEEGDDDGVVDDIVEEIKDLINYHLDFDNSVDYDYFYYYPKALQIINDMKRYYNYDFDLVVEQMDPDIVKKIKYNYDDLKFLLKYLPLHDSKHTKSFELD